MDLLSQDPAPPTDLPPPSHPSPASKAFVLGTRNSQLALIQTSIVRSALLSRHPSSEGYTFTVSGMTTTGDRNLQSPLYLMGGKALWTQDLEVALLQGSVDVVVHSLKDMPTQLPEGCELGAILEREDPRDALVVREGLPFKTIEELPAGSVVGTSSVRRVAQLRRRYPGLEFQDIRGNLNTRFKKLDAPDSPFTAIILAVAGLVRLDLAHRISSFLSPPSLYHAVGQGALGLEIRAPDFEPPSELGAGTPLTTLVDGKGMRRARRERAEAVRSMVKGLEHWQSAWKCEAERELLRTLEGGCSVPVGCFTTLSELPSLNPSSSPSLTYGPASRRASLTLKAVVTSLDGSKEVSVSMTEVLSSVGEAVKLGRKAAETLKRDGADEILEELGRVKKKGEEEERARLERQTTGERLRKVEEGEAGPDGEGPATRAAAVELETGTKIVDLTDGEAS